MRFLMLTAAFGTGHNQVAEALAETAVSLGHTAEVVDGLAAGLPGGISTLLTQSFIRLLNTAPSLYRMAYNQVEAPGHWDGFRSGSIRTLTRFMSTKLLALIAHRHPDVLVCTHPFVLGAIATLRRQGLVDVPVVGVLTDFAPHAFWLHEGVCQYYVATSEMTNTLVRQGVPQHHVSATGIPIRSIFAEPLDRETAARDLGLDPHRPTVLLMGGGLGMGPMQEMAQAASKVQLPLQLLAVTGHNRRLYEQLNSAFKPTDRKSDPSVHVYRYVHDVHNLMAASDILISKAGAVTASEALAAGLPMLLVHPIAGHEERNQEALVATGAACAVPDAASLVSALSHLLTHPEERAAMKRASHKASAPQAALHIISHLTNLISLSGKWSA